MDQRFAASDPYVELACLRCDRRWAAVRGMTPEDVVAAFDAHARTFHTPGVWLVGGEPGGAADMVCDPCGGGGPDRRPLPGGPNHAACRMGKWGRGSRCPCRHRSRDQLRAIAGGRVLWSDPAVQSVVERTRARWSQLGLWGDETL